MSRNSLCFVAFAILTFPIAAQSTIGFVERNQQTMENAGTRELIVARSGSLSGVATVNYFTIGVSAEEGKDYVAATGTLTFNDQESQKSIFLTLLDDNEPDATSSRTIEVRLDSPTNASIGTWSSHFLYVADDEEPLPPLTLSYENLTWPEGDGETSASITVKLNRQSSETVTVSFRGYTPPLINEYNGANVRITSAVFFEPGETTKQVPILIQGNDTYESVTKTWHFTPQPGWVAVSASDFEITLVEDDPQAVVSIQDATVVEGSWGSTEVNITLTASQVTTGTIQWSMNDGTATAADIDYGPNGIYQPIRFNHSNSAVLTLVAAGGDLKIEPDETFSIVLSSPTNMLIDRGTATITIVNDDVELPRFSGDETRIEPGSSSSLAIEFPAPAPKGSVFLSSSDPAVTVPNKVEVPEQATSISFPVDVTRAVGPVTVSAVLDPVLGDTVLHAMIDTFAESSLHVDTARRALFSGETAQATVTLSPPSAEPDTVALTSSPGVVAPASVEIPAGSSETSFAFTVLSPGSLWIRAESKMGLTILLLDVSSHSFASLSPSIGSSFGGNEITIRGNGFSPGCGVLFGEASALTTFVNPQTLIAMTPAHRAERVDVTVMCGATPATRAGAFEFAAVKRRATRH
jgi:hypothetical protein